MKQMLRISEMMPYLPSILKDAIHHVAKDTGNATDALELHRHTHSEKAKVNELDPTSRKSLAYVSYRTQDRDDEIVIPQSLKLDEFRKYASVLVNHNYSLLPVGSDEMIEADDYGIKALTVHADTGAGTMANVVWDLVRQGHLKGRSVGFVPTSYTKPGARDWDHVANQLQSNWKEFDKGRAEKSVSRIITGGVLLEHSFVSVPCNVDAELIGTVKAMNLDGKIIKQLGWAMKDGILVNKAEAEPVPCVCDECGFVKDAVPGSKCPECKTGDMKAKGREKAIEVRVVSKGGPGSGSWEGPGDPRFAKDDVNNDGKYDGGAQHARDSNFGVGDKVKITGKVNGQGKTGIAVGFDKDGSFAKVRIGGEVYSYHNSDVSAADDEDDDEDDDEEKGFHSHAIEVREAKGGPGSGNFGHSGRPGEVGGSGEGGGSKENADRITEKIPASKVKIGDTMLVTVTGGEKQPRKVVEILQKPSSFGVKNSYPVFVVSDQTGKKIKLDWGDNTNYLDVEVIQSKERSKGFHSRAVEKPNPHMPGGSFTECVVIMEGKGHSSESAKKICGALQADAGGKGLTKVETKAVEEITGVHKAMGIPCTCDECGAEDECAPGSPCLEDGCEGVMRASKKAEKGGSGSGNFGHEGRPGEVGGSGSGGGKEGGGQERESGSRFEQMVSFMKENGIKPYSQREGALRGLSSISLGSSGGKGPDYEDIVGMAEDYGLSPKTLEREWNKFLEYEKGKGTKSFTIPEIKVVRPAPQIKVLYVPPDADLIAKGVSDAVERALSRKTGRIV